MVKPISYESRSQAYAAVLASRSDAVRPGDQCQLNLGGSETGEYGSIRVPGVLPDTTYDDAAELLATLDTPVCQGRGFQNDTGDVKQRKVMMTGHEAAASLYGIPVPKDKVFKADKKPTDDADKPKRTGKRRTGNKAIDNRVNVNESALAGSANGSEDSSAAGN